MRIKLHFFLLISFLFFGIVKAQESESKELTQISIPANIKQEIVRRILVFKFKPTKRPKVVNLAKQDIDSSWLPKILNIEFRLLSDEEVEDSKTDIYFFTPIELERKTYSIGFAFGDPGCDYSGNGWSFRITNNRLRLWYAGRIGGGCGEGFGGGSDFETPGELNSYPNELDGYKFFDQGKLKGLKLTVSTREEVEKIFGSDCDADCDYNENWKISFDYFGPISKEKTVDNKKITYVPKKELVGKIYSITLFPKRKLPFDRIAFPRQLKQLSSFSVGDNFDTSGQLTSAAGTSYKTYLDRYGLKYEIYEGGYTVGDAKKDDRRKGDLMLIEYTIPDKIEETTFVEES
jgi:hypothetical protein